MERNHEATAELQKHRAPDHRGEGLGEKGKAGGNIWDKWQNIEAQKAPPDQTTASDHPSSPTARAHGASAEEVTGLAGSTGEGRHGGTCGVQPPGLPKPSAMAWLPLLLFSSWDASVSPQFSSPRGGTTRGEHLAPVSRSLLLPGRARPSEASSFQYEISSVWSPFEFSWKV